MVQRRVCFDKQTVTSRNPLTVTAPHSAPKASDPQDTQLLKGQMMVSDKMIKTATGCIAMTIGCSPITFCLMLI